MAALHALADRGQSVWLDSLRRALVDSGQLARYVTEHAVTGVTSNLTVFEHALAGSDDYDGAVLAALDRDVLEPEPLLWELAVADVTAAADVLRGVFDASGGVDGFVSLELPPRLTRDPQGSIATATDLARRLDRPNTMVKVPGTPEAAPAVTELVARGVNVHVTLLFSPGQWRAAAEAYLRGLERRREEGLPLEVTSVASLLVSRIDARANPRLPGALRNRLGVATAAVTYDAQRELHSSARWQALADAGARPQRLLWASTSPKDPDLPEHHYVSALAAPGTVDTMAEHTLLATAAGGELGAGLPAGASGAAATLSDAARAGVDVETLGGELQEHGEDQLEASFSRLLACLESRAAYLEAGPREYGRLASVAPAAAAVRTELTDERAVQRLFGRDPALWPAAPGAGDRLGWLALGDDADERAEALHRFVVKAAADGLTHAVVVGMGGSSMFPLVAEHTFGAAPGLDLYVLDSVDPEAIHRVTRRLPTDSTLVIASSKSGTTIETRALLEWFWERYAAPERFVAITDPGSPLARLARERGFREVLEVRDDLGGRYSALSPFGLVPAALAGADVAALLHRAGRMLAASATCVPAGSNPGLQLAAVLAGAARAGRDKLTLALDDRVASFGLWLEQLVAESTGKGGQGLVPVVGEPLGPPDVYGPDRLFVGLGVQPSAFAELAAAGHPVLALRLDEPADLGAEVMRWEIATALAGSALGIDPFDQPDVEAAKEATRHALESGVAEPPTVALHTLLDTLRPGDHLAIQAYVDPESVVLARLQGVRTALRDRYRVATSLDVGPRYLHSTGQLHKGGPERVVVVQVVGPDRDDPLVPGRSYGFATLKRAQAAGDLAALQRLGRRAGRVALDELAAGGLA